MKICIGGHFKDKQDEGVRIVTKSIAKYLAIDNEVITFEISNIFEWNKINSFKPDVIHYVLSPTKMGLFASKISSFLYPKAKTIITAPHSAGLNKSKILTILKPDIILTQSEQSEKMFKSLEFKTIFIPNGVDINKFKPITNTNKIKFRIKYGIKENAFIILHVASFHRQRNLEIMKELSKLNNKIQILLIGRTENKQDYEYINELNKSGCMILNQYFPNIEEIYALSDCYLFPTINDKACIETPLSILESMACNIPVITTKFGALPGMFKQENGYYYADSNVDFINNLKEIISNKINIKTREMVLPYSWENIIKQIVQIYKQEIIS